MKITIIEGLLFGAMFFIEAISFVLLPDESGSGYEVRDTFGSLSMGLGNVITGLGWGVPTLFLYVLTYHFTPLRIAPTIWAWIGLIVLDDLRFYWVHRANHKIRILWASHVVHHSSQKFNLSTAIRQSWTDELTVPCGLPLALLGFSPSMIFTAFIFSNLYQFPLHTRRVGKMWKPIELVMNTPSHHRVHHGVNPEYLDRNFGAVFIIWDRIFGTFALETVPVIYGIGRNVDTFNTFKIGFREYLDIALDLRRAPDFHTRMGILFRSPGWSAGLRKAMSSGPAGSSAAAPIAA